MKKILLGFIVGVCATIGLTVFAELVIIDNPFPIFVNGVQQDVKAYNIDGSTYLPLRRLAELLNVKIDFNDQNEIIIGQSFVGTISDGVFSDVKAPIIGARLSKDYNQKPCLVITYDYTNLSDETKYFLLSVSTKAFQDGIRLDTASVVDSVSSSDAIRELKTGANITVDIPIF